MMSDVSDQPDMIDPRLYLPAVGLGLLISLRTRFRSNFHGMTVEKRHPVYLLTMAESLRIRH